MDEREKTRMPAGTVGLFSADAVAAPHDRRGDFVDETFTDESFLMDESSFDRCRMVNCTLKFGGLKRPHLMNCSLKAPKIQFIGAAATTFHVLIDLGQSGYPIQPWLDDIRRAIADKT